MSWRVGCKETGTEVVAASLPHTSTDSALMQLTARVSGSVFAACLLLCLLLCLLVL